MQLQEQTSRERASSRTAQAAGIAVTLGLTLLFLLLGYARGAANLAYMNADSLYGYLLLRDMFESGEPFQWFLQPANNVFPDLLLLALAKLFGGTLDGTYILYSSLYFPLLFLSLALFLRSANLPGVAASLIAACVVVFALFLQLTTTGLSYLFTVPAHHAGAIPLALLGAGAALRAIGQVKSWWSVLLSLLLIGGMFSDSILLVQLVAPLTVYFAGRLVLLQGHERRETLILIGIILLSAGVGAALRSLFDLLPGIEQAALSGRGGAPAVSLFNFLDQLPQVIEAVTPAVSLASALGLLLALFVLDRWLLLKKSGIDGLVYLALCSWAALLGPIAAGTWINAAIIRHQLPVVIAPTCLLICALYLWVSAQPHLRRILLALMALLVAGASASTLRDFQAHGGGKAFSQYQKTASQIGITEDDLILVEYWKAKPLQAVTGQPGCPILDNFSVFTWIMNLDWCRQGFESWRDGKGRLVVAVGASGPASIVARFGPPLETVENPSGTFLAYRWAPETEELVRQPICRSYAANAPARAPAFCQ